VTVNRRSPILAAICASALAACAPQTDGQSSVETVDMAGPIAEPQPVEHPTRDVVPLLPEDVLERGEGPGLTGREADLDEEDGTLDQTQVNLPEDTPTIGVPLVPVFPQTDPAPGFDTNVPFYQFNWILLFRDSDGDCLLDFVEHNIGTDPSNPDTDGDGWFDGPCNERYQVVLTRIYARDEQEDAGRDELYLIADNVRHPHGDLDDYWSFNDGDARNYSRILATRTRGRSHTAGLRTLRVEGWEDDVEVFNNWSVDDYLFRFDIDIGAYEDGDTFRRRHRAGDWDYELTFRIDVERFSDPTPLQDADADADGIKESDEYRVSRRLGGIADPEHTDVLVEVDWMSGHYLRTAAKRQVITQMHRHGVHLEIWRHRSLAVDDCLTVPETRALYNQHFTRRSYRAFRYAIMTEQIWNDASGVAWGDLFLMDDSTWWINGRVLAQAGTFIHELGHTLGLVIGPKNTTVPGEFWLIDSVAWFSYDSAMNYTYQATKVDYSSNGSGGSSHDHDDWEDADASAGLGWQFGTGSSNKVGVCN